MIKSCQNVIITKSQRFESYFSKANVRSPILAKTHVWKSYFSNFHPTNNLICSSLLLEAVALQIKV